MDYEQIPAALIRKEGYSFLASLFLLEPNQKTMVDNQEKLNRYLEVDEFLDFVDEETLKQQYYDLFFVPSSGVFIPPFESALKSYQPEKKKPYGQLFGKEAVHVQSCYEAVGFVPWDLEIFKPLKDVKFPDHIGYELAFMSLLCGNEAAATDEEKETKWQRLQLQFLSEHLARWVRNFANALENNTDGYYQKAGKATKDWVMEELQFLEEIVSEKKGVLS